MLGTMMLAGIGALCISNPRRKKRRAKSRRVYRRNPALTSAENLTVLRDALAHRFPFVKVNRMTLGGEERASFSISVSLDPRESWANGIYQNSRFRQFMVNADGSMYEISGSGTPRFRKTKVKEITDVVRKLDAWKPQTNPRSHTGRKITKKQFYADGAWSNSKLYRIQKGGRWHYYRTNPARGRKQYQFAAMDKHGTRMVSDWLDSLSAGDRWLRGLKAQWGGEWKRIGKATRSPNPRRRSKRKTRR